MQAMKEELKEKEKAIKAARKVSPWNDDAPDCSVHGMMHLPAQFME